MKILNLLEKSKTQYHTVEQAVAILNENGFSELNEETPYNICKNGKYYVRRNGSALIAFTVGNGFDSFNVVASHTDSPCFKVKLGKALTAAGCTKLPVEQYGGSLRYSWFDRPLKLCGRLCGVKDGKVVYTLFEQENPVVIPSVAIHYKRNANEDFAVNVQTDCTPLYSLGTDTEKLNNELNNAFDGTLLDGDLFLVCDEKPFVYGANGEFACAPRVDNLTSCFASIAALVNSSNTKSCNVCYLADNEEVGSRTKQGAASKFLYDTLSRINTAFDYDNEHLYTALANSFVVSCDNAHATHPNHPELADNVNNVLLGSGVVIKHHANQNYTTDGLSSAIFKSILNENQVDYCDFYMRSDLPCGGTLGAISSSHVSVKSVDIGMAQLAMHSACETFALKDYEAMEKALTGFYNANLVAIGNDIKIN